MTAALGLCLIGPLQSAHGWEAVWLFLIACVFASMALIFPKVHKEIYQHDADFERVSLRREEETDSFEALLPRRKDGTGNKEGQERRNNEIRGESSSGGQNYRYGAIV